MRGLWTTITATALLAVAGCTCAQESVTVAVDTSVRQQTIMSWGQTTPWLPAREMLRDQSIDRAVNDLGINRLRFEGMCGNKTSRRSWEWLNDNDDPFDINWEGFNIAALDQRITDWLLPWKRAVEARGETFDVYLSPSFFKGGSTGDLPPWMKDDPEEYAEWAMAWLLRMRDEHGIVPQWYSICNEAGNNNVFSPRVVADMIKALVPRMREAGFETLIQFPESINAQTAWRYIEQLQDDPQIWDWIGLISYHWYGRDNQTWMVKLRDFAVERGLPTAQTEFMNLKIDHLYDDMTLGGVSYWEIYGLATPDYGAALSHVSSATFRGGKWYWHFRQVSHYVRPGAARVAATSSDEALRCLAYEDDGRVTTVLINTTPPAAERAAALTGLPAGEYGISRAVGQRIYEELGARTVDADGKLSVTVPANAVLTVYARDAVNRAPTVTEWRSRPDFLAAPAASLELACAAQDPELDALNFSWTVVAVPDGAQVTLARPDSAVTRADGLTIPGEYVFAATVSDGTHEVTREVLTTVFKGNQPPVPMDVHNRIPVWVTVADGGTLLRGGSWDIEGDPVTFHWSIAAQPDGASPVLETPDDIKCRVTGMTVAGDYVFRLTASDPTHTVTVDHTVPVYP